MQPFAAGSVTSPIAREMAIPILLIRTGDRRAGSWHDFVVTHVLRSNASDMSPIKPVWCGSRGGGTSNCATAGDPRTLVSGDMT
jgi:hypothetical protein